jgi:hypothetical protein
MVRVISQRPSYAFSEPQRVEEGGNIIYGLKALKLVYVGQRRTITDGLCAFVSSGERESETL